MNSKIIITVTSVVTVAWIALVVDAFSVTDKVANILVDKVEAPVAEISAATYVKNTTEKSAQSESTVRSEGKVQMDPSESVKDSSATEVIEQVEPESTGSKMGRIHSLVKNSITEDSRRLDGLQDKRERLLAMIDEIDSQKGALTARLDKLIRINSVFDESNVVKDNKPTKDNRAVNDKVKAFNKLFDDKQVKFSKRSQSLKMTVKGESLLLIDEKPLRISEYAMKHFSPIVEAIKSEKYRVQPITIELGREYSEQYGDVLRRFLSRQYGWNVDVKPSVRKGLKVNVTAKR